MFLIAGLNPRSQPFDKAANHKSNQGRIMADQSLTPEIVSENALVESQSVRNTLLAKYTDDNAQELLNKAKALLFAMCQGQGLASTEQVASYFGVTVDAVKKVFTKNRKEFESDGARVVTGKELRELRESLSLGSNAAHAIIFTPRATVRLGFLLVQSEIAANVRTQALNVIQQVPVVLDAIATQSVEIEKLRLENENLKLQVKLADSQQKLMASVHLLESVSPGLAPLALGRQDAVVERIEYVERTITPNATYEGVGITYIQKRFGFKTTKQAWAWLESIGYGKYSGKWDLQLSAVETHKMPPEGLNKIAQKFAQKQGCRQLLIGE